MYDYTHYFRNKVGFQDEVNQQLVEEVAKLSLPSSRKCIALLIDEMKIKEGLVYNKHTGKIAIDCLNVRNRREWAFEKKVILNRIQVLMMTDLQ